MDHDGPVPDYYAILKVPESATTKQIRDAYKRCALENHPDRVPQDSPERKTRTRKFQLINDAYYALSDKTRRNEYDIKLKIQQRRTRTSNNSSKNKSGHGFTAHDEEDEDTTNYPGAFPRDNNEHTGAGSRASWSWNPFSGGASTAGDTSGTAGDRAHQTAEDAQFADAFEEMMRDAGMAEGGTSQPTNKFWSMLGGVSGGALGFIVGNVPGMFAGAVAGNRLGAIRDDKGMSVYSVFQQLPQDDRSRLLGQLAARVLSHAAGI